MVAPFHLSSSSNPTCPTFFSPSSAVMPTSGCRLALFDIDGTLIVSRSGARWATDAEDWIWAHPNIPQVLQQRATAGWIVALVSNQQRADVDPAPRQKIESVLVALEAALGWRPITLIATGPATLKDKHKTTNPYRKPARGLYDILLVNLGLKTSDVTAVTMCGDAVGAEDPYPPYRWTDSDRQFAANIGAKFERPCDVFGMPEKPQPAPEGQKEIVLLVGNPGSGKSTTGRHLANHGYVHVEQDVVGNKNHTVKFVKTMMKNGIHRFVVDATHGNPTNRLPYEELAREHQIPLRILWHIRDGRAFNAGREKPVPEVAYGVYTKYFDAPDGAEIVY